MTQELTLGERPVFEVVVESLDLAFEIRVNDLPVLRFHEGGNVRTGFDVNPYVLTGENTLTLIVRPLHGEAFGPGASALVGLRRRKSPETPAEESEIMATLVFEGPGGDVAHGFEPSPGYATTNVPVVQRLGIRGTQSFTLETPFPPWPWMSAPKLARTEAVRNEVLAEYRRLHALLRLRDAAGLLSSCALQARDYQAAYYLATPEEANRMLGVAAILSDPDLEVEDFPEAALDLELLADGRLAQLVDEEGKSPLRMRFRNVDGMVARFNAVLLRTPSGWTVVR
jgi:hypothetical protein